ncbi:MAG: hypothetical protein QOG25_1206 [Acetobacteraceae bacterium]|nr:hypothetical protein [Acetobacteraceae bacterium]
MNITIVADQGSHLLVARGDEHAVIERRNGLLYNCHDEKRGGIPAENIAAVGDILDPNDWTGKEAAQTVFDEVIERGKQLAQRML